MARPTRPRPPRLPQAPTPDRSLAPDGTLPTIAVRAAGQHPFIYRKMIIGPIGPAIPNPGDLVRIVVRDSKPLGYGLWNVRSQVGPRLPSREAEPPGPEFWEHRLATAVHLRRVSLCLD